MVNAVGMNCLIFASFLPLASRPVGTLFKGQV